MGEILSKLVPVEFSTDGGTNWKVAICRKTSNFDLTTSSTKEETDCGVFTAPGTPEWSVGYEGVVNDAPSAAEVSYKDILTWANSQTKVMIRQQAGAAGASFYQGGEGYITALRQTYATNANIAFSFTFSGSGALDIQP